MGFQDVRCGWQRSHRCTRNDQNCAGMEGQILKRRLYGDIFGLCLSIGQLVGYKNRTTSYCFSCELSSAFRGVSSISINGNNITTDVMNRDRICPQIIHHACVYAIHKNLCHFVEFLTRDCYTCVAGHLRHVRQ